MKPTILFRILAILSIFFISATGCVTGPQSVGDNMTSRSDLLGEYGDQWKEGSAQLKKGKKLVRTSPAQIKKGLAEVKKGEKLVKDGNALLIQSREDYQAASAQRGLATTSKAVKKEGETLTTIGSQWKKAVSMVKKGKKLVRKGNKRITRGENNTVKGNELILNGRQLMQSSEDSFNREKSKNIQPSTL